MAKGSLAPSRYGTLPNVEWNLAKIAWYKKNAAQSAYTKKNKIVNISGWETV